MSTSHGSVSGLSPAARVAGVPPPTAPVTLVARPDLHARIDALHAAARGLVLLICAPAGSGKTLLLAEWAARARTAGGPVVAWLTVTEQLDDPAELWAALGTCLDVSTGTSGPGPATAAAERTIAALTTRAGPTVLVLDDAHLITDPLAAAGLEYFLRHAPPTLTTVVCGRFAPAIRWHLLDVAGRLTRWGAGEFALDSDQVRALCLDQGCALTDSDLAAVVALTEGWAALVRLAATHLAAQHDRPAALARLPRAMSEFLSGELVAALSPTLRQFLTYTSVPESFTEELADELVGGGAGHCLYQLDALHFPVTSTVRGADVWFTYHPMLRAYFRAEADRLGPQTRRQSHLQCARWLHAAGLPQAALAHLLAVPERGPVCEFLSEHALTMVLDGAGEALFDALTRAAPDLVDDPYLWVARVVHALQGDDLGDAVACLAAAHARRDRSFAPAQRLDALARAAAIDIAAFGGGVIAAAPGPVATTGTPDFDVYLGIQHATALVAHGAVGRGEALLRSSLAVAEHLGRPRPALRALTRLAIAASAADAAGLMRERAARALALAAEHGLDRTFDGVTATAVAAHGAYLQGEAPQPEQLDLVLSVRIGRDGSPHPVAGPQGRVIGRLLELDLAEDASAAVDAVRRSLLEWLEQEPAPHPAASLLAPVVWALLRGNETGAAQLLVERARQVLGDLPDIRSAEAALAYAANRAAAAAGLLGSLLDGRARLRPLTEITSWLLLAGTRHDSGSRSKTLDALDHALTAAAPHRLVRPFLDVPAAIPLLDRHAGCFGRNEHFADLIRRHPRARRRPAFPALTRTEMTVLELLPSGRTAQQIAAELGVSVNTVKTHLRGIYGKLGSSCRLDALATARRSGLI